MSPTPSVELTTDIGQSVVGIAASALRRLPCAECMLIGALAVCGVIYFLRVASPTRMCRKMDAAFDVTERMYHGAVISGVFSSSNPDVVAVESMFSCVQTRISHIHERRLRKATNHVSEILEILRGQSREILLCMWDIQRLQNKIEILREVRLRSSKAESTGGAGLAYLRHANPIFCNC
ncbi:hypothetical protein FB45DRAFT_1059801 [Roridomyces roridus]|uniref:Uncharacterized protein n=1 Tax=Roridomyces roridus TaxID=1738132 RepID=A0AAD7FLP7_9AGAR|nr:hypothetical protein FB45DRAFT_1059801 [Roridomyces roridus]